MTHQAFWAGVFRGHSKVCAGALRSTPLEQYEHYGRFRVRCDTCSFDQLAGVSVEGDYPAYVHVEWTENQRQRGRTPELAGGLAVSLGEGGDDDH